MDEIYFEGKFIIITVHAIKQARKRRIAFPDQVYDALKTGKIKRFVKKYLRFIKKGKEGSIICIREDIGHAIIIKTIERGT